MLPNQGNVPAFKKPDSSALFVIETFSIEDNRELRALTPDKDGYYCGVPMAVLGTTTRNNTEYEVQSTIASMNAEDSPFRMRLTEGCLFGEWGHPFANFATDMGMSRLLNLDPQFESHHFRKVYSKKIDDLGVTLILADVKPSGPYGKYFEEKMADATRNLAFSLRSITREQRDPRSGISKRKVVKMVTFDAGMASGGYKEASKRYSVSTENFGCYSSEDVCKVIEHRDLIEFQGVALECFSQSELNELLQSNRVTLKHSTTTFVDKTNRVLIDMANKTERGIMHTLLRAKS